MKIIAGLTGPTGAGKSEIAALARKMGITVIDCDKVAREAVKKGTEGLAAIEEAFGKEILLADGTLDRKALARIAFADKEKTELLNTTLLPYITKMIKGMIKDEKTLLDAPTLFESGINGICNKTVAVLANKDTRLQRIIQRDNISPDFAKTRIGAGKDDEFYKQRADYIIFNDSDIFELKDKGERILKEIFERN